MSFCLPEIQDVLEATNEFGGKLVSKFFEEADSELIRRQQWVELLATLSLLLDKVVDSLKQRAHGRLNFLVDMGL